MVSAAWRIGLFEWQTSTVSLVGLGTEIALAVGYLALAMRAAASGRPWPVGRTTSFLAGLLVLAFSLQSGFARYDEIFWVHVVQHQLLMSLAPVLLVVGMPLMLLLRAVPGSKGRRLVGVLRHRRLHWMDGRSAAVHLPLQYYGVMCVYLPTPAYALSERNQVFHEFVHVYFVACGLMFWLPVLGGYPSRWHPTAAVRVAMVAVGVPVNLALAGAIAAFGVSGSTDRPGTLAGVWALVAGTVVLTALGLVLVRFGTRPLRRPGVRLVATAVPSAVATSPLSLAGGKNA
jgi:cytochrome c oxidase assembly factor CtaG